MTSTKIDLMTDSVKTYTVAATETYDKLISGGGNGHGGQVFCLDVPSSCSSSIFVRCLLSSSVHRKLDSVLFMFLFGKPESLKARLLTMMLCCFHWEAKIVKSFFFCQLVRRYHFRCFLKVFFSKQHWNRFHFQTTLRITTFLLSWRALQTFKIVLRV